MSQNRPVCSVEGCSLAADFRKSNDGQIYYFKWCQKHRKRQPKGYRILDHVEVKTEIEYNENGRPLCAVLGCKRIGGHRRNRGRAFLCDLHGRSYHVYADRLEKKRHGSRLKRYGVSNTGYERMVAAQGGLCAICHTQPGLAIDHCHKTGRVRALLCTACNAGIGQFRENIDYLMAAIQYLKEHNHETE